MRGTNAGISQGGMSSHFRYVVVLEREPLVDPLSTQYPLYTQHPLSTHQRTRSLYSACQPSPRDICVPLRMQRLRTAAPPPHGTGDRRAAGGERRLRVGAADPRRHGRGRARGPPAGSPHRPMVYCAARWRAALRRLVLGCATFLRRCNAVVDVAAGPQLAQAVNRARLAYPTQSQSHVCMRTGGRTAHGVALVTRCTRGVLPLSCCAL